jgi:hypothetical protein
VFSEKNRFHPGLHPPFRDTKSGGATPLHKESPSTYKNMNGAIAVVSDHARFASMRAWVLATALAPVSPPAPAACLRSQRVAICWQGALSLARGASACAGVRGERAVSRPIGDGEGAFHHESCVCNHRSGSCMFNRGLRAAEAGRPRRGRQTGEFQPVVRNTAPMHIFPSSE